MNKGNPKTTNTSKKPVDSKVKGWRHLVIAKKTDLVLGVILILTILLYAMLMLTDRVPIPGLVALGITWLVYALIGGRLTFATPMDLPILGLLGLLPLSLSISIDWSLSLPKVYGLILGIVLFYLAVNTVRNYSRLQLAIWALILLGMGTAFLGLLTADWTRGRFTLVATIQQKLMGLLHLSSTIAETGEANVNTIGGALTFFVPCLGSLLWDGGAYDRKYLHTKQNRRLLRAAYYGLVGAAFLFILAVLILTESRSAYLGCITGLFALLVFKDRRFLWLILLLGVVSIIALTFLGQGNPFAFLTSLTSRGEITLQQRFHLWQETIGVIQDFPLTGGGIFTSGRLLQELYTFNLFPGALEYYSHAHNIFLSVAFDLGIPGLVLYSALLGSFGAMTFRNLKVGRSIIKVLIVGLACGMLAHLAFGLMDANNLGTKLGAVLWLFLGLNAAVYVHRHRFSVRRSMGNPQRTDEITQKPTRQLVKSRLLDLAIGSGLWVLISLAAVSFINFYPLVSITAAILGGGLLGVFLMKRFRRKK